MPTNDLWQIITHLGASSLLLPVIVLIAAGLWQSRQTDVLRFWAGGLVAAILLTLASKIAYMGWGLGIASLDFTGISGHTLLATSVLPVLLVFASLTQGKSIALLAALTGLLAGMIVGVSRLALHTHSSSEVISGWLLGATLSYGTLRLLDMAKRPPSYISAAPLLLLLAFNTGASTYLPSHQIEIRLALLLSGREMPVSRTPL